MAVSGLTLASLLVACRPVATTPPPQGFVGGSASPPLLLPSAARRTDHVLPPRAHYTELALLLLLALVRTGIYHAAAGTVADGQNSSAYGVGSWGVVAIENGAEDGGMAFKDDIEFNCDTVSVNALFGMVIAASEGGVFSNANDTDLLIPLSPSRGNPGPRGAAGMLQAAARFSTLSKAKCPQVAGVIIDDFWSNYNPRPNPPPPPGVPCATCPASHPHGYGSALAGWFCCSWKLDPTHHCTRPPTVKPKQGDGGCCLFPGEKEGCQMDARCGNNPSNSTPCALANDELGPSHMLDLQAALKGKTLRSDGSVDHASPATTPHLKIFVVTYNQDLPTVKAAIASGGLIGDGIVEGLSYWIGGPTQITASKNLTSEVRFLRKVLPAHFPIFTGGYLDHSRIGWLPPASFYDMLTQSIDMYEQTTVQGFFIFSGSALHDMNASTWKAFDIPTHLEALYFPHLGSAVVSVSDATTGAAVADADVTVVYEGSTHVTHKSTSGSGQIGFGGWVGRRAAKPSDYTITVSAPGHKAQTVPAQLKAGETTEIKVHLSQELSAMVPAVAANLLSSSLATAGALQQMSSSATTISVPHLNGIFLSINGAQANWTQAQWETDLHDMKAVGIEFFCPRAAADGDGSLPSIRCPLGNFTSFYPSKNPCFHASPGMPEGGAMAALLAAARVVGLKVHLGLAWPSSAALREAEKPINGSYSLYYRQMAWLEWDTAVELWSLYGEKHRTDIAGVYTMIEESNKASWFTRTTDLTGHYLEPLARDIKQNLRCVVHLCHLPPSPATCLPTCLPACPDALTARLTE